MAARSFLIAPRAPILARPIRRGQSSQLVGPLSIDEPAAT